LVSNGDRDVSLFTVLVASRACVDGEDEDDDVFLRVRLKRIVILGWASLLTLVWCWAAVVGCCG
jgi:hypothetical protein